MVWKCCTGLSTSGIFAVTVNKEGKIIYGLGAIKGIGEGPVQQICEGSLNKAAPSSTCSILQSADFGASNVSRSLDPFRAFDGFWRRQAVAFWQA